jgi:hypothetical protein
MRRVFVIGIGIAHLGDRGRFGEKSWSCHSEIKTVLTTDNKKRKLNLHKK